MLYITCVFQIDKKLMKAHGMVARVRKEVEIHSRLKHPSILEVFFSYFGEVYDHNDIYIVLYGTCRNKTFQKDVQINRPLVSIWVIHWGIIFTLQLYNYFEDNNYVYLVLEICMNGELNRYLKANCKVLTEDEGEWLQFVINHTNTHSEKKTTGKKRNTTDA